MVEAIKRIIAYLYPEIAGRYYLPKRARVMAVSDVPAGAALSDTFRPRYAVDLQLLDRSGRPDLSVPILQAVPLPLLGAGHDSGVYQFPQVGAHVVLTFIDGLPDSPIILQVLPTGKMIPSVEHNELLIAGACGAEQRADNAGNWWRTAGNFIIDRCRVREVEAVQNTESYSLSELNVTGDSSEIVGATKLIKVMGCLNMQSAGELNTTALGDINTTTKANENKKIKGASTAEVTGIHSVTAQKFAFVGTGGSADVNLLALISEAMAEVSTALTALSTHGHGGNGASPPANAASYTAAQGKVDAIKLKLDAIKG